MDREDSRVQSLFHLTRRELLSSAAAVGMVSIEPFLLSAAAKADDEDDTSADQTSAAANASTPSYLSSDAAYSNQYNPDLLGISSLDLLSRDPLLVSPPSADDDSYGNSRPLRTADGALVQDKYSPTGYLRSPPGGIDTLVKTGQALGACLAFADAAAESRNVVMKMLALVARSELLAAGLGASFITGGAFDYQRTGMPGSFSQYPQYRDLSNAGIGIMAAQANISEATVARIAGVFAGIFSSNGQISFSDPQNWMAPRNREMIGLGYGLSSGGAFTQPPPNVQPPSSTEPMLRLP